VHQNKISPLHRFFNDFRVENERWLGRYAPPRFMITMRGKQWPHFFSFLTICFIKHPGSQNSF